MPSQLTRFPSSSEAADRPRETLAQPHSTAFPPPSSEDEGRRRPAAPGWRLPAAPEIPRYRFNCPITRNVAAATPAPPPQNHARLFISQPLPVPAPHPARTNSQVVAVGFFFFPPLSLSLFLSLFPVGELRLERRR